MSYSASKNIVDKKRIHNILCFMAKKSFQIEYSMIHYLLINSLLFFIRFREALYDYNNEHYNCHLPNSFYIRSHLYYYKNNCKKAD